MKKQRILCPVDYSDSTEPAIRLAAELAQVNNSKVVLLHVIESNGKAKSINESSNQKFQERLRDQYLDLNGVEHEFVARHGDPAKVTVEYAKQHKVDRIVMGTHGRTGLRSVIVGSVAKYVMAHADCPVVTVKLPIRSAKD